MKAPGRVTRTVHVSRPGLQSLLLMTISACTQSHAESGTASLEQRTTRESELSPVLVLLGSDHYTNEVTSVCTQVVPGLCVANRNIPSSTLHAVRQEGSEHRNATSVRSSSIPVRLIEKYPDSGSRLLALPSYGTNPLPPCLASSS